MINLLTIIDCYWIEIATDERPVKLFRKLAPLFHWHVQ